MEEPVEIKNTVERLIGEYGWMFIIGFVGIMFQSTIKSLAASLAVFCGGDYNTDDVVFVDGRPGRIIRVGLLKTVFFIYNVVDNKIVSGNKLVIQNEALSKIRIEKPLPEIDLTKIKN
jgi:hypothetical protein|tara:strand:- start:528 stop:881 length:354 start_codon:yes stop_codon:yes gene_type:complete